MYIETTSTILRFEPPRLTIPLYLLCIAPAFTGGVVMAAAMRVFLC